jgi:hypothetical protein
MSKKFLVLASFVLVFGLTVSASAVEERWLDVNNFSFEMDTAGNQVCAHSGNGGLGWVEGGAGYCGQDVYCGMPGFCMSCEPFAEGCNCKAWQASDGWAMIYMQTSDVSLQQYLAGETIHSNHQYKLVMDAMSWNPQVWFHAQIIYPSGAKDAVAAEKIIQLEQEADPNTATWTKYEVIVVVPPGHPAIGQPLGIKWLCFTPAKDTWQWAFLDNIRVSDKLAVDAWNPNPEDGAINVALDLPRISWSPGLWTDQHQLYFSTSWADVNAMDQDANYGRMDPNYASPPLTLQLGSEYFWRIVEHNDAYVNTHPGDANYPDESPWPGPIWIFKTNDGKAFDFYPEDEAIDVPANVTLHWTPGQAAAKHNIFLSTDFDDVNSRAQDANQGWKIVDNNTFDPTPGGGNLVLGETYYWAVDEVNSSVGGSPWRSAVQQFVVIPYILVDDFEDYVNSAALTTVWKDYYTQGAPRTQAYVYLDTATVHDSNKAMKYFYNNNITPRYAEARATCADLGIQTNWATDQLKALTLYFHGGTTNVKTRMYVALTDSANRTGTVVLDDPNNLTQAWKDYQEWNIELQRFVDANSINLSSISKMTIGFGNKFSPQSATGTVYFDDIRLYPSRCVLEKAAAKGDYDYWDGDCAVDYSDVNKLSDNWLLSAIGNVSTSAPSDANKLRHYTMDDNVSSGSGSAKAKVTDSSAYAKHGELYDGVDAKGAPKLGVTGVHTVTGKITRALTFDGIDDFVELPSLDVNTNTITFSAWATRGVMLMYSGILYACGPNVADPNIIVGYGLGAERVNWTQNYTLWNMWDGDDWMFDTGFVMPGDDLWSFMAMTIAPNVTTLYMYDGIELRAARNFITNPLKNFTGSKLRIADQIQYAERMWAGKIDDVRIYNYTLTPGQILYLSRLGVAGSQNIKFPPWRPNGNADGVIDLRDFAILGENWLEEALWP